VTYEKDVVTGNRKMGRYGDTNGIHMNDPHAYTDVEIDERVLAIKGIDYFKYGTFTPGVGIRFRTENPGGSQAYGSEQNKPRKTGLGLPWDL